MLTRSFAVPLPWIVNVHVDAKFFSFFATSPGLITTQSSNRPRERETSLHCFQTATQRLHRSRKVQTMIRPTYSQTENNITVGAERFRCLDMLSQPSFIGEKASGFRDTSFRYIMKCAVDIRKVVRDCRVVSGTTVFHVFLSASRRNRRRWLSPQ